MPSQSPTGFVIARRILIPLIGLLLLGYLAWVLASSAEIDYRIQVYGLFSMCVSLLACGACLAAALRSPSSELRLAWACFALGQFLAAAFGLHSYLQTRDLPIALNLAEPLRLGAMVFFLAGLLVYPRRQRRLPAILLLLDAIVVVTAILVISWTLAIRPLTMLNSISGGLILYPAAGLILMIVLVVLFMINDSPSAPVALTWTTLSLLFIAFSALNYAFMLRQGFSPSLPMPGLAWAMGAFFMTWGALSYPDLGWRSPPPRRLFRFLSRIQPITPHLLTFLVVWQILVSWLLDNVFFPSGPMIIVILGLIIYTRSRVAAGENEIMPYASLVNSVAEPAFVCDDQGLLRLVNPALLAASGYPAAGDLLNHPLQLIFDAQTNVDFMLDTAFGRQIDPGDTRPIGWSGEVSLRRRNGSLMPVYLSLRPINPDANLFASASEKLALAGTAHDLTRHKKQQAELQQAYEQIAAAREQLEHMNADLELKVAEETENLNQANQRLEEQNRTLQMLDRLKSDFVSLVSHELRAPLTNINGGIELVLSRPNPLEPGVRSDLELVQSEITRLTRFVETILDLSALDAGRLPLYISPISYESVVRDLQNQLIHLPGLERLRWQAPPNLPYLLVDEHAIASILFHLLDNAIKYAPEGEIVTSAEQHGHFLSVSVTDSGPGIPPEALPLVFDRFYRANSEDSQTVYGHGLGLYIVRRLIEAMGGRIEVFNRPEGGARFTCWLRLESQSEEAHASKDSAG